MMRLSDPFGTPIDVLATGKSLVTGETYPVVWIAKHPKAKIVCITLGHDGAAHELPAYKTILQNSVQWLVGKQNLTSNTCRTGHALSRAARDAAFFLNALIIMD